MPATKTLGLCSFIIFALALSCSSAERQYFPQKTPKTWVDARKHCQVCFKELVTLTPENTQTISQGLTLNYWIGLRKRPLNATDNNSTLFPYHDNSTFWSRWANGEPLAFQNWYPGFPVFKSPYPKQQCCSCSCTCPARPTSPTTSVQPTTTGGSHTRGNTHGQNTSVNPMVSARSAQNTSQATSSWSFSTAASFTNALFESECVQTPLQVQGPDPDENYIEDPCVAMLRFGAWVEKECYEPLPFICYEDRFYGEVQVTNIKSSSADISWEKGPGEISHYRLEVTGNGSSHALDLSEVTRELSGLEPGTSYSVQVFPVKCGRDLNPENQTFYTVPNKVTDLHVVNSTENCVFLNWKKPSGRAELYNIETGKIKVPNVTETEKLVCGLSSGSLHTFIVTTGVWDQSQHSENATIEAYTKPEKVSNLQTSDITAFSMVLSWDKPPGEPTGYQVNTSWGGLDPRSFLENTEENKLELKDLPSGTKITLKVTALVNKTLEGESLTVSSFTKPEPITSLNLSSTHDQITARWDVTGGSSLFAVELFHGNDLKDTKDDVTETTVTFLNLASAARYTVTVFSVTSDAKSEGFNRSIFTTPKPPRDPEVTAKSTSSLTFTWRPPVNTGAAQYAVVLNSSFWGQQWRRTVTHGTTVTFDQLKSGTSYTFRVQTVAGSLRSHEEVTTAKTVSIPREITLSVVCSSQHSLLCDSEGTRDSAFRELRSRFETLLGDSVEWSLEKMETENTG